MPDEPRDGNSWEDLFGDAPHATDPTSAPPLSRRELRAAESGRGRKSKAPRDQKPPKRTKKRRIWIPIVITILVILGLVAGTAAYVWANYEDEVRKVMGWELPPEDYVGEGTGEATLVIEQGDDGFIITQKLVEADIIKGFDAFYALLLQADPPIPFYPGYYVLSQQMSSEAALRAIQDPANRIEHVALIHEGRSIAQAFETLSVATEIPVADFEAAAADRSIYGVPAEAPSLEGYLFPATYRFDPGATAESVIRTLVNRTFQALDSAGVAPEDRHSVLTMAALIQREAGPRAEDFYKVSRVFANRLENGWKLESDATVSYGTGRTDTVWTTVEERADASNLYNTYANPGLPIGPIGAAGDLAIDAALHPVDGPWFYFVPVNLETGETKFSETFAQHNAAVRELQQWCRVTQSPNCD